MANDIAENGIREPLQVSTDGYIISGHRRYAAAKLAKLKELPVKRLDIAREDYSSREWQKLLSKYNLQRTKNPTVKMKEALLNLDAETAHKQLLKDREERDRTAPPLIKISGKKSRSKISKAKRPMLKAVQKVLVDLKAYLPLTVRSIHYQLLNDPPLKHASKPNSTYVNDAQSYKNLIDLLIRARLTGEIPMSAITDETRPVSEIEFSKNAAEFMDAQAYHFLRHYRRDLMQTQPDHIEVICEKKHGAFDCQAGHAKVLPAVNQRSRLLQSAATE